jgi:acetyl-CoA carboxylase, biotin carboxylase subunit
VREALLQLGLDVVGPRAFMFKKLLIANRGEIAVRIARACREMGISPVAVYSDADRASLHVRTADQAVHIGPSPSNESYLVIEKIIAAARSVGAEAVHPGYGFLSENADFAQAVEDAGLALIGPPASAMRLMGSKTSARSAAQAAGVPVVPGTITALTSVKEAESVAENVGYPVMLKAASGGGGKGLRLVRAREELAGAYSLAQSEAAASFKDASVYIEKYIERPRHIEIQLIGDQYGNMIHLGERECSLQRRHQKVIEECPSPVVDQDLRQRMGEAAVRVARAAGYVNAGTIEFLVDEQRNFYFLEMNTRLQVEHPVTELVTGRDLVHEQIRVAAGEKLQFAQSDIAMRGAAIECRIYAEDPDNGFLPSPGRITKLVTPAGPGVRYDSGSYQGWDVPIYYDSLLAKLCVWAETREAAVNRLARVLDEYSIEGINTTVPFFRAIVRDANFKRGEFDTGFIDRFLGVDPRAKRSSDAADMKLADLAAIAAVLHSKSSTRSSDSSPAPASESRWKREARIAQRR